MIIRHLFSTLCFPWLLFDSKGRLADQSDGILFPSGSINEEFVESCKNTIDGFHQSKDGLAIYVKTLPILLNWKLVLYGLKVTGVSTKQGRTSPLSIKLKKQQIEDYMNIFMKKIFESSKEFGDILRSSVHEVRSINTDIKNAAHGIRNILDGRGNVDLQPKLTNDIIALSEILSTRTDFLSFIANPSARNMAQSKVGIFQKFDKVKKSLEMRANKCRVGLSLRADGIISAKVNAIDVFDIVPYIAVQNAIKYSPANENVNIRIEEGFSDVFVTVDNYGPTIGHDEFDTIFESGKRGSNAIVANISGSGYGLYFLKLLIFIHNGELELRQNGRPKKFGNVEYMLTTLTLRFKRADV